MRIANLISSLALTIPLLADPSPVRATPVAEVAVGVSVRVGPPFLPVYAQPPCPEPGYIWEPGYWAYGDEGYYWVPGIWILPPAIGLLWTPGYWGFADGFYVWHVGYWGPVVGFYGGINYGFGYVGSGFYGGYWRGDRYFYNTRVTNVNTTIIRNVYNGNVVSEGRSTNGHVSFNGGPGGVQARPTSSEVAATHQRHVSMTSAQMRHQGVSSTDRTMLASVNHGRPVTATARSERLSNLPAAHSGHTVTERPPTNSSHETRSAPTPSRPAPSHPANPVPTHHAPPAPKASPAPSHRSGVPAQKPDTLHPQRPVTHQPAPRPVPPTPRPSTNPRSTEQRPATSHPSPNQSKPHSPPPHASTSRAPSNERPQPTKPEHP